MVQRSTCKKWQHLKRFCGNVKNLLLADFDGKDFMEGGAYFNHSEAWELSGRANITEVMIACAGDLVSSIQMKYGGSWTGRLGSSRGLQLVYYPLDQDEYVNTIVTESALIKYSPRAPSTVLVNDLKFVTNRRTIGPCGPFPGNGGRLLEHSGSRLLFIAGYSGAAFDTLVFHWDWNTGQYPLYVPAG